MGCSSSIAVPEFSSDVVMGDGFDMRQLYELQDKLGSGTFGEVHRALSNSTNTHRAVKMISLQTSPASKSSGEGAKKRKTLDGDCLDKHKLKSAQKEAEIWAMVGKHKHCVELRRTFVDVNSFFMVMDKCEGNLLQYFSTFDPTRESEKEVARIFREMVLGVAHVHSKRIVHRDVKPDNFLLGGADGTEIKLCDFGLAAVEPKSGWLCGSHGTAPYMSPEMAGSSWHTKSTDIWSLGASAYLLLYYHFPYMPYGLENDSSLIKRTIIKGFPSPCYRRRGRSRGLPQPSQQATSFVRALLERAAPQKRISAEKALQLDFVREAGKRAPQPGTPHAAADDDEDEGVAPRTPVTV